MRVPVVFCENNIPAFDNSCRGKIHPGVCFPQSPGGFRPILSRRRLSARAVRRSNFRIMRSGHVRDKCVVYYARLFMFEWVNFLREWPRLTSPAAPTPDPEGSETSAASPASPSLGTGPRRRESYRSFPADPVRPRARAIICSLSSLTLPNGNFIAEFPRQVSFRDKNV